jgi:ABC-2 type transport system ATP-binding protein
LTTQYLEEADFLADLIAVIDHGRTIAQGTADELKRQVGGERIELTIARDADIALGAQTLAPHVDGSVRVEAEARRLSGAAVDGARRLADVVRDFDAAGIGLDDLAVRRPTLDDVFLTLTGHAAEQDERDAA